MIELPDFAGHADALWNALLDLEGAVSSDWVLVVGRWCCCMRSNMGPRGRGSARTSM
jgi:hypothetical protein